MKISSLFKIDLINDDCSDFDVVFSIFLGLGHATHICIRRHIVDNVFSQRLLSFYINVMLFCVFYIYALYSVSMEDNNRKIKKKVD